MTVDDKLEMKSYNVILTERLQNYQHHHRVKLINIKILKAKKYYLLLELELLNKLSLLILR